MPVTDEQAMAWNPDQEPMKPDNNREYGAGVRPADVALPG